mgnify:CR=1 FL=1
MLINALWDPNMANVPIGHNNMLLDGDIIVCQERTAEVDEAEQHSSEQNDRCPDAWIARRIDGTQQLPSLVAR